jgi:CheY-like chemotaxis protein
VNEKITILLLEDSVEDANLIKRFLERSGLVFESILATDKPEFLEAFANNSFDIVLSDHKLPQFGSVEALQISREKIPNIPFILVTGTVSEEFAVSIMKQGANDYILKNNLQHNTTED